MSIFSFFYVLFGTFIYILALPYIVYKSRHKKYKQALPARFFLKNNPPFENSSIWFHTCSMGETQAIQPITQKISNPNISVITNTGYEKALTLSKNTRYLPFEIFLPFWIKNQKALVVMEAELWYMLFYIAKRKKIPTVLINARISDKSYHSYKRFAFLYKKIFQNIDKVFAQSHTDKQRLEELGAKNIEVIGNIKLAKLPKISKQLQKPDNKTLITAGSTHENEEELILHAFEKKMGRLVIVPRHPERFDKVHTIIQNYAKANALSYHRYSQQADFTSDIVLVDAMGELNNIYNMSDVVILGGGFVDKAGGHNPIEPAYFQCKLISGHNIFNQKSLFECVKGYVLIEKSQLHATLHNIDKLQPCTLVQKGDIEPIINYLGSLEEPFEA